MSLTPIRERDPVAVSLVGLLVLHAAGPRRLARRLPALHRRRYDVQRRLHRIRRALRRRRGARIAGVKVGEVTGVSLDGPHVKVDFKVKDAWIGDATVGIALKTLLGEKYLAVDPLGNAPQDPGSRITASRTTSRTTSPRRSTGSARPWRSTLSPTSSAIWVKVPGEAPVDRNSTNSAPPHRYSSPPGRSSAGSRPSFSA
ncbi:hypothetical protein SVIOM74S_01099 [Streptomyces violarus]